MKAQPSLLYLIDINWAHVGGWMTGFISAKWPPTAQHFISFGLLVVCSAASHAAHQRVSHEEEPEAHRPERHDAGAASGYCQRPSLPNWKWVLHTQKSLTLTSNSRNEQESKWGKNAHSPYWSLDFTVDVKVLFYMLVQRPLLSAASPEYLLLAAGTHQPARCSGMNNLSSYMNQFQKSPRAQTACF